MAGIVNLARKQDRKSSTSSISLFDGTDGIYLVGSGWNPSVASPGDETVMDVLHLLLEGTNDDNLAEIQQSVSNKLRQIDEYNDIPTLDYGVWLESKLINETRTRSSFLLSGALSVGDNIYAPPVAPGSMMRNVVLTLERMPYWEYEADTLYTSLDSVGGMDNLGTIPGNKGGRIASLNVYADSGKGPFYEGWIAFRSDLNGTAANFTPVLECEDGTLGTDASINSTSEPNTASPGGGAGSYVTVDFSTTATMAQRVRLVNVNPPYPYPFDQHGTYQVLLRAKVGSSTECRVKLLTGHDLGSDWDEQERVAITSTTWKFYNLGQVSIPGSRLGSSWLRAIRIDAERESGSNDLLLDCVGLVPIDESALYFTGASITSETGSTIKMPPCKRQLYAQDANYSNFEVVPTANYCMPVGTNVHIIAFLQRETESVLTDSFYMSIDYNESWNLLKGAT